MELARRHLRPGELDHELVWLSVSLAAFGIGAVWLGFGWPWPRCVFHDFTGLPCLTCGATRAAIQFFHGHFWAALTWNPLAFAALCAVSAFNVYAAFVVVARARRLRILQLSCGEKNLARLILIAALVLNWCYLLDHWRSF